MISLLVPTRGRPQNIRRLAETSSATAAGEFEVVWCVDSDDTPSIEAVRELGAHHKLVVADRVIPAKRWNEAYRNASGDIFGMMGDDCVFHASGWDTMVEDAFAQYPDGLALVYGPDGFRNDLHASHPFLSHQWAELLGGVTVEYFSQDWNDTWMNEIAEAVGRRHYIPSLDIAHLHPDNPALGIEYDQTYQENRKRCGDDKNAEKYIALQTERDADAQKLREAINAA